MRQKPVKQFPKMTKGKAFTLCLLAIILVYCSMFAFGTISGKVEIIPVNACLKCIEVLAGMYIVGSVANNGVKGAFWNQDMFDSENREGKYDRKK